MTSRSEAEKETKAITLAFFLLIALLMVILIIYPPEGNFIGVAFSLPLSLLMLSGRGTYWPWSKGKEKCLVWFFIFWVLVAESFLMLNHYPDGPILGLAYAITGNNPQIKSTLGLLVNGLIILAPVIMILARQTRRQRPPTIPKRPLIWGFSWQNGHGTTRHKPSWRRRPSRAMRRRVLKRDHYTCQTCGRSPRTHPGLELQIDHIIPVRLRGPTVDENLQALCKECNLKKGGRLIR